MCKCYEINGINWGELKWYAVANLRKILTDDSGKRKQTVPNTPGIYIWRFTDEVNRFAGTCDLAYVGKSRYIRDRLKSHLRYDNYDDWAKKILEWPWGTSKNLLVSLQ